MGLAKRVLLLAGWLSLVGSHPALSISRVGNSSIGNSQSGFIATIDPVFCLDQACIASENDRGQVLLQSPFGRVSTVGNPLVPPAVWVDEFSLLYPSLSNATRDDIVDFFLANPDWKQAEHADPCVLAMTYESASGYTAMATWGSGKGVVFVGQRYTEFRRAVRAMMESVVLVEGACSWSE